MTSRIFAALAWVGLTVVAAWLTGCAALPALPAFIKPGNNPEGLLTSTSVEQTRNNFRVVHANVVGTAEGFRLFGLLSFKSATYAKAFNRLHEQAPLEPGRSQALANIVYEKSSTFYILYSIPKVTVRADIIEFVGPADGRKEQ